MQEELEDEIKLSVGKQPSPAVVLCLEGSPDPLPICGMPRTWHFIEPKCCKDLGHQINFYGGSWWLLGVRRGTRSLGGPCTQFWGRWLSEPVLVCLLSDRGMGWGRCWGSRRRWLHATRSVIQLGVSSLRLCLGALSAAEHQMLIRIIKGSCNTDSNDSCASGGLLGRTSHDTVLHRAGAWRLLPVLQLLLKAES